MSNISKALASKAKLVKTGAIVVIAVFSPYQRLS
jgi:hypothetical protein